MTKSKGLGSLLNFLVPGLGNAYGRKIKKGILTYILFFIVVLSLRFTAYSFTLLIVSVCLIVGYYLYLITSGFRDVQKDKRYEPAAFDKWYVYILVLAIHWAFVNSIKGRTLDNLTPINFASIPTPAMDPGLLIGDILAFEKTKSIERNDVVTFWFPDDVKTVYIKRCIGLPGDSLQIQNGIVLINGSKLPDIPLKYKYLVTTEGAQINPRVLVENQISESDYYRLSSDAYMFFLTTGQAEDMRKLNFLKGVELSFANEGEPEPMIYPKSESILWNTDFYGPVYIQKRET
jgi:signal peptidase I